MRSRIKKVYGETVSVTTHSKHLLYRLGYQEVLLYCPSAWRMALVPRLHAVKFFNGSTYTDYSTLAMDRDDGTHVPLDGMTTSHYLYLGFTEKVRGFYFNIDGTNKNAVSTTLDMEYCSAISGGIGTFTNVDSDSDGTDDTGATLGQAASSDFTLPAVVSGSTQLL